VLIVLYALFPRKIGNGGPPKTAVANFALPPARQGQVGMDIHRYLADLNRTVNPKGGVDLFLPECLPLAAPFLLFRLKREGYSRCRASISGGGLHIHACR
jgi:hypothetical protein